MDTGVIFERIEQSCKALEIDLSVGEMASFAEDNTLSQERLEALQACLVTLKTKSIRP